MCVTSLGMRTHTICLGLRTEMETLDTHQGYKDGVACHPLGDRDGDTSFTWGWGCKSPTWE